MKRWSNWNLSCSNFTQIRLPQCAILFLTLEIKYVPLRYVLIFISPINLQAQIDMLRKAYCIWQIIGKGRTMRRKHR